MNAIRVEPTALAAPSLRRHALLPLAMVSCGAVYYGAGWPLSAVVGLACVLLLLQSWIGPWARTSRERLDRDLLTSIAKGKRTELPKRFGEAWGFRAFGAPGEVAERRGRVLLASGDAVGAQRAYAAALEGYGNAAPLSVVHGYGKAAYQAGDDAVAIEVFRAALDAAPHLGEARLELAHAIVRSGGSLPEAEGLFAPGAKERVLVRVAAALSAGDHRAARKLLASADRQVPAHAWLIQDLDRALGKTRN